MVSWALALRLKPHVFTGRRRAGETAGILLILLSLVSSFFDSYLNLAKSMRVGVTHVTGCDTGDNLCKPFCYHDLLYIQRAEMSQTPESETF